MSLNKIFLIGNMVADPELKQTPNGVPVTSFRIAVNRKFARQGEQQQTDFFDVVCWRQQAEFVCKWFSKGQMCALTGRLQIRDWTDREGGKRRSAEVVADNVYFTESKKSRESSGFAPAEKKNDFESGYTAPVSGSDFAELDEDDGDLPF